MHAISVENYHSVLGDVIIPVKKVLGCRMGITKPKWVVVSLNLLDYRTAVWKISLVFNRRHVMADNPIKFFMCLFLYVRPTANMCDKPLYETSRLTRIIMLWSKSWDVLTASTPAIMNAVARNIISRSSRFSSFLILSNFLAKQSGTSSPALSLFSMSLIQPP